MASLDDAIEPCEDSVDVDDCAPFIKKGNRRWVSLQPLCVALALVDAPAQPPLW
jgi:hypothetical protein